MNRFVVLPLACQLHGCANFASWKRRSLKIAGPPTMPCPSVWKVNESDFAANGCQKLTVLVEKRPLITNFGLVGSNRFDAIAI